MEYDVFISHASEDKQNVALPLALHLQHLGLKVWLDEFELTLGDSLRRSIDRGLSQSRYGVVILSPAFFSKEWPNKELDGLVAREDGRDKVILPVWHNVSAHEILNYSPTLADKLAVSTSRGLAHVAEQIFEAVRREINPGKTSKVKLALSETEILQQLSRQMLVAGSAWQLRQTLYELEEYLAKYPHSPNARLLKDRIQVAMRRAEAMESAASSPMEAPQTKRRAPLARRSSPIGCLWRIFTLAAIGSLLYLLLQMLF
jgi:TIR domain